MKNEEPKSISNKEQTKNKNKNLITVVQTTRA